MTKKFHPRSIERVRVVATYRSNNFPESSNWRALIRVIPSLLAESASEPKPASSDRASSGVAAAKPR